jgi:hypothetical protein
MKTALAIANPERKSIPFPVIAPKRFKKLTTEGLNPDVVKNPVVKMLIQGDAVLSSGRRCSIAPEDEMLIFLD